MNPEVTTQLLEAIIAVIAILITGYLIPWLKSTVGTERIDQIQQFVEVAVRAAEQLYTPEEWKEKKLYVEALVVERAKELNITLNAEQIDALIEGVVNYVKHNDNKAD